MAYVLIPWLINFLLLWHGIESTVINCTIYPTILQQIPDRIVGTIAISNSSNEEVFWDHIDFKSGVQFPLNFVLTINDYKPNADSHIFQLHIYQLPRAQYDLPLWSADSIDPLIRKETANSIIFFAHKDRKQLGPCIMGVIINTQGQNMNMSGNELMVKVGSMPSISLQIHRFMSNFPLLFTITEIPVSKISNSTSVAILISNPATIIAYEAREKVVFTSDYECATLLFKVSEDRSMNLTVTMSAHVFTSISLLSLGATYRIYKDEYLLFERSEIIDTLEFPFITQKVLVPITTPSNYSIEATIFGPVSGFSSGMTLFQGMTYARLVPGTNNNVKISMLYTGLKIGTTIIGTVRQTPLALGTWPLAGSNLAFAIDDSVSGLAESNQFTIFDQTFPIQFTLLNVQTINQSYPNIVFTVTITYTDGTVIWGATNRNNKIVFGELNRLDINLTAADGYRCQRPGQGYCERSSSDMNITCCSQFKCSHGQCKLL